MQKITEEELKEINELRLKMTSVIGDIGNNTLQIKLLQQDIKQFENTIDQQTLVFQKFLEDEKTLVQRLSEKYGVGSINFETGEFTPEK